MKKKSFLLLVGFSASYLACQKPANQEIQKEEKLSSEITINGISDDVDNTEGCNFISWYNPSSGVSNPNNAITCWNSKPKSWPNLNIPNRPLPDWYLAGLPDHIPEESISMELKTMGAARYYTRWAIEHIIESVANPNGFLTPADMSLSSDQILFLDDHFALQTLLFDDYYTRFGTSGKLFISQELADLFQVYCYFKNSTDLFETQINFFGEQTPGNSFSNTLDITPRTQNISSVGPVNYSVQHLIDTYTVEVQDPTIGTHKIRLPRWYFYYYLTTIELSNYIVLH